MVCIHFHFKGFFTNMLYFFTFIFVGSFCSYPNFYYRASNDSMLTITENKHILCLKGDVFMATTNLNIRTDKEVKDKAEEIFSELGLNMTTAVNIFLRTAIREHGIPFELKLDIPNDITAAAIEEGRKIMSDPNTPRYSSMDALREALEV